MNGELADTQRLNLAGRHHPGRLRRRADRGGLPHVPGRRRGGARHVQRERPGRLEHDREGRAADPGPGRRRGRGRRAGRRADRAAPERRHDRPRGAADRLRGARDVRQRGPRRRAADPPVRPPAGGAAGLRPRPRQGPGDDRRAGQLRRRRLPAKTPLEETLPVDMGVRDRQKQPDVALVVVIDQSGSMDACHCNSFDGGAAAAGPGIGGRAQGRYRQGGDPAGRGRADRARRARRRVVQRAGPLGRQDPAARRHRRTCRARSPASSRSARPTSSRASSRPWSRSRARPPRAATSSC